MERAHFSQGTEEAGTPSSSLFGNLPSENPEAFAQVLPEKSARFAYPRCLYNLMAHPRRNAEGILEATPAQITVKSLSDEVMALMEARFSVDANGSQSQQEEEDEDIVMESTSSSTDSDDEIESRNSEESAADLSNVEMPSVDCDDENSRHFQDPLG